MSDKIIQSYVFGDNQAWFISTINREYDIPAAGGTIHGTETLVWEWSPATRRCGKLIDMTEGAINEHLEICKALRETGKIPERDIE